MTSRLTPARLVRSNWRRLGVRSSPHHPASITTSSSIPRNSIATRIQDARQHIELERRSKRRALLPQPTAIAPTGSAQRASYGSSSSPDNPQVNAAKADGELSRTELHDLHVAKGGKMVPFGGYSMPVQYSDLSVGESHKWTRDMASLFDVGHMVQHEISGPAAALFLETVTPSSASTLKEGHSTLSCLLHPETGGIVDDTVITKLAPDHFYLVTNAACRKKDLAYITENIDANPEVREGVKWTVKEGAGLIALQGPLSADVLEDTLRALKVQDLPDLDLKGLYFGQCARVTCDVKRYGGADESAELLISRGGYTGEDGFEISVPQASTQGFAKALLEAGGRDRLRMAGLGARDSLRLEAGMCLYGHDLDDTTTPIEAGLAWVVPPERRKGGYAEFHGSQTILKQLEPRKDGGGVERKRVGLILKGAPAREGAQILTENNELVGKVTSGCPSPTLGQNIAMGYVKFGMHKPGTKVAVMVRGKKREAEVVKMPFVKSRYWKQAAGTAPG